MVTVIFLAVCVPSCWITVWPGQVGVPSSFLIISPLAFLPLLFGIINSAIIGVGFSTEISIEK